MNNRGVLGIRLAVFLAVLACVILTYRIWLPLPGTLLLVKDNYEKSDCVVPLGGDEYFRFKKAVDLYKEGFAKYIVFSPSPEREKDWVEFYNFEERVRGLNDVTARDYAIKAFEYFGMDSKNLYLTPHECTSTFDEAEAAKKYLIAHGYKSMILVTSTYHMRRALLIFKLVFKGTGIKVYNCTAKSDILDPYHWWRRERDVKMVFEEYVFTAYNLIYHFLLGKGKTAFDTF